MNYLAVIVLMMTPIGVDYDPVEQAIRRFERQSGMSYFEFMCKLWLFEDDNLAEGFPIKLLPGDDGKIDMEDFARYARYR